ncbi:FliM/FliN family flagellar motor switch protein [Sandaracinus amylolyticus]|uniref:Flagellar motor switch protein FliM n=1 Tax=Sandaracinus amylolyticus TaxID=927083 RepID=A0A0F6SHM0_9BACT|nr:FliM/FliN family flagellar motor switch protein [Sandaracinus amylolyticus]AKF10679.1 Type III secretion inner membrane protein [Sandaracinus amylolyticus]
MPEATPFPFDRLPRVTRAEARLLRRCARRLPLAQLGDAARSASEWLGATPAFDPLPIEPWAPGTLAAHLVDPLCAVIAEPAAPLGARIAIDVEPRLAAVVVERVLGAGDDAPLHPGALTEAERGVLAYAIARALGPAAGGALRIATVVTTPEAVLLALGDRGGACWPLRASLGAHAGIVRVWIPEALLARSAETTHAPHAAALGGLAATIVIGGGRASLGARDVVGLAEGDVVILDDASATPSASGLAGEVIARVRRGATRWRCALEGAGGDATRIVVRAIEPRPPVVRRREEEVEMAQEESGATARMLEAVGDAPVELVVELARFEMPLAELAALRPGEVLATGRALGERVVLRAGERTIALGELVEIEGEIGVRVLALG